VNTIFSCYGKTFCFVQPVQKPVHLFTKPKNERFLAVFSIFLRFSLMLTGYFYMNK
jgi:hypothetical protein